MVKSNGMIIDDYLRQSRRWWAFLTALVLLWFGTGVVLNHTDDPADFGQSSGSSVLFRHLHTAPPPAAPDNCAACQWSGLGILTVSTAPHVLFGGQALPIERGILLDNTIVRTTRSTSSRAPLPR